ncbi:MAG: hypothetical protein BroJett011_00260 [Chloroflexota bacterium]|nr:MAG: hypothetical protein BroJett011_00260 [Chloroflexota bacterium]
MGVGFPIKLQFDRGHKVVLLRPIKLGCRPTDEIWEGEASRNIFYNILLNIYYIMLKMSIAINRIFEEKQKRPHNKRGRLIFSTFTNALQLDK